MSEACPGTIGAMYYVRGSYRWWEPRIARTWTQDARCFNLESNTLFTKMSHKADHGQLYTWSSSSQLSQSDSSSSDCWLVASIDLWESALCRPDAVPPLLALALRLCRARDSMWSLPIGINKNYLYRMWLKLWVPSMVVKLQNSLSRVTSKLTFPCSRMWYLDK